MTTIWRYVDSKALACKLLKNIAFHLLFCLTLIQSHLEGCPKPSPSHPLVTPHMNLFSGCDAEIKHLLEMRAEFCFYCAILDTYAPCIVSARAWNNDANMTRNCCTTDQKLFNTLVLSVSDEAFLLLVLINAGARWMAELKRKWGKVSTDYNVLLWCLFFNHHKQTNTFISNAVHGLQSKKRICP